MEAPAVLLLMLFSLGHSCFLEKNVEYFDNDEHKFNSSVVRKDDWESCATACKLDDPKCSYWTFFEDTNECYFKVKNTDRRTSRGALSGERECAENCQIEQNVHYEGDGVKDDHPEQSDSSKADDWKACAKKCTEIEACTYWSFIPGNSTCYFKAIYFDPDRSTSEGAVSGNKICGV